MNCVCKVCGVTFAGYRANNNLCSGHCGRESERQRGASRNLVPTQRKCPICETNFLAKGSWRKYCSDPCQLISRRSRSLAWSKNNPDRHKESTRRSHARLKHDPSRQERAKETSSRWRAENKEWMRTYYIANKKKIIARQKTRYLAVLDTEHFKSRMRSYNNDRKRRERIILQAVKELGLFQQEDFT